jgi:hypothetical protein
MNFLTVSGTAAQRVSPGADSLRTAIFVKPGSRLADDQDDDERNDEGRDGAPLQQLGEPRVIALVSAEVLRGRFAGKRFMFRHVIPLWKLIC